jgi:hypothetical protein
VYFDDRPGLAAKFDETVQSHTIRRPEKCWMAMAAAGVPDLSKVVTVRIVECEDPGPSDYMNSVLRDRWALVRRVVASLEGDMQASCSDEAPEIWEVNSLKVNYALHDRETPAESVLAVLDQETTRLLAVRGKRGVETALARELAFMILPHAGSGPVAAALKELLVAESTKEAEHTLSELGFADVALGNRHSELDVPEAELAIDDSDAGRTEGTATTDIQGGAETSSNVDHEDNPSEGHQTSEDGGDRGEGAGGEHLDGTAASGEWKGRGAPRADGDQPRRARKGKFVGKSFVKPEREAEEAANWGSGSDHELDVDRRGTELVMLFERQQGRQPRKMGHFNKGYDIESLDESGAIERYIEVKSLSSTWDMSNVPVSPAQFKKARDELARFWLYVVDNLGGDKPTIYRIQDLASKVVEYRFDDGWRKVAESSPAPARRSILTAKQGGETEDGLINETQAGGST